MKQAKVKQCSTQVPSAHLPRLYLDLIWALVRPKLDLNQTLNGPYLDLTWAYLDLTWISPGPYLHLTWPLPGPTWNLHELYLYHNCTLLESRNISQGNLL